MSDWMWPAAKLKSKRDRFARMDWDKRTRLFHRIVFRWVRWCKRKDAANPLDNSRKYCMIVGPFDRDADSAVLRVMHRYFGAKPWEAEDLALVFQHSAHQVWRPWWLDERGNCTSPSSPTPSPATPPASTTHPAAPCVPGASATSDATP